MVKSIEMIVNTYKHFDSRKLIIDVLLDWSKAFDTLDIETLF